MINSLTSLIKDLQIKEIQIKMWCISHLSDWQKFKPDIVRLCEGNANTYSADGIENGYNYITIFGECLSLSSKV